MVKVDILLATYKGAEYLAELLESLERQTFTDWRLIVRDDGSTDETVPLVEAWAAARAHKVRIISDGRGQLGACGNFDALLAASEAPYFMFCDQDDVWLPEKASRLLDLIRSVEALKGEDVPIMAHSDLSLVDPLLRPIHPSFKRYVRIRALSADRLWRVLLVSNIITGCASIGNAALRRMALPIPPQAAMHDWWLALVAAMLGEIAYLPEATVLYRQHGVNTVGAKSWSLPAVVFRLLTSPSVHIGKARRSIRRTQEQATVFASRYAGSLDSDVRALVGDYGRLNSRPIWYRKAFLLRHRLWGRNPIYSAMLLLLV
jgi:glycosyltransferase involved in cell wall biosynthesis